MASFTFRLQPLLKLREAERDRCREQLAQAYRAEQILLDQQGALQGEISQTRRLSHNRSQPGRIEVDGLLESHRYELLLRAQLQQLGQQHQQITEEIERRRQALVEADQGVRTLDKLRERHRAEHLRDQEKQQMREMDEAALRRHQPSGGR
jgi:flagellar export protein FliJ